MNGRRVCDLYFALGEREECPGGECGFWEDGSCAFKNVSFEFEGRPDVARYLLGIRSELENARAAPNGLQASLPPGLRG
jgi:hypothetical protein